VEPEESGDESEETELDEFSDHEDDAYDFLQRAGGDTTTDGETTGLLFLSFFLSFVVLIVFSFLFLFVGVQCRRP
jgi:hypothetical protein